MGLLYVNHHIFSSYQGKVKEASTDLLPDLAAVRRPLFGGGTPLSGALDFSAHHLTTTTACLVYGFTYSSSSTVEGNLLLPVIS